MSFNHYVRWQKGHNEARTQDGEEFLLNLEHVRKARFPSAFRGEQQRGSSICPS